MNRPALIALLALTSTTAQSAEKSEFTETAMALRPGVNWQATNTLKADFTCRGHKEVAMLGTQGENVFVAIQDAAGKSQPIILKIESGLLASQSKMTIESLDYEVGTAEPGDPGPLPGYVSSKTCKGLRIDDERIDSVHVYWNRFEKRFQTWQR